MDDDANEFDFSIDLTGDFYFLLSGEKVEDEDRWYGGVNFCQSSPVGWAGEELEFFEMDIEATTKEEAIGKLKSALCSELEAWIKSIRESEAQNE